MDRAIAEAFDEQRRFISAGLTAVRRDMADGFREVNARLERMDGRFDRFESKIDAFIDLQTRLNRQFAARLGC